MRGNTFFTPFIENGKFVTTGDFYEYVPESPYWQFALSDLTPEEKRLAHISQDQEIADLYAPNTDEPGAFIPYTSEADLQQKLATYAQENTALRAKAPR